MCPVVSGESGNTVALQGKPGPKGEPGVPGKSDQGPPVSTSWGTVFIVFHTFC